jgi:hypothetical protein
MTTFVHLTSAKHAHHVARAGIRASPARELPAGVFAMPVVPSYLRSHQWMRELRKWSRGPIAGVYFRIPDDELVWAGRYTCEHRAMSAAQAAAAVMHAEDDALGYEVIILHSIAPSAIQRIRYLSFVVGWRHYPGAHRHRPCGCPACVTRGEYKARRLREQ